MKILKIGSAVGVIFGIIFAMIVSGLVLFLNKELSILDGYKLSGYFLVIYGFIFLIIGFVFGAIAEIILKNWYVDRAGLVYIEGIFLSFVTILFLNFYRFKLIHEPVISFAKWFWILFGILIMLVIANFIGYIFYFVYKNKLIKKVLICFLILFILIAPVSQIESKDDINYFESAIIPRETNTKVIVFGIDGATWSIINEMIEKGELKNFEKIIKEGNSGNIKSLNWPASPIVTNSIISGKAPEKHGIKGYAYLKIKGLRNYVKALPNHLSLYRLVRAGEDYGFIESVPVSGGLRNTKSFWDILTENEKTSGIVGWTTTWPAEKINGIFVSDRIIYYKEGLDKETIIYPAEEFENIKGLIREPESIKEHEIDKFVNDKERKFSEKYNLIKGAYAFDETSTDIGIYLIKKKFDVTGIYVDGVDYMEHMFWKYKESEYFFNVDEDESNAFSGVIDNYYKYFDEKLGEILNEMDGNTVLIVFSDNGQDKGEHERSYDGVIIFYGNEIKEGNVNDAKVYDIVPMILYFNGLPIAEDMDGRVLTEVIDEDYLRKNPVRYIRSYEVGGIEEKNIVKSDSDQKILDVLRNLGYAI